MLNNKLFVGGQVNAIDFVAGNVAMNPLNVCSHRTQDVAGLLRDGLQFFGRELSGVGYFSFYNEFGHVVNFWWLGEGCYGIAW